MTYDELIEKIDLTLTKIQSLTPKEETYDYSHEYNQILTWNEELTKWANFTIDFFNDKRTGWMHQEDEPNTYEFVHKMKNICAGTHELILSRQNLEKVSNPASNLGEFTQSLTNLKTELETSKLAKNYADIVDKTLVIEEKYQNGEASNETANKNLDRLKKLDVLSNPNPEFANIQTAIKNLLSTYEKEMQGSELATSTYSQDPTIPDGIAESINMLIGQADRIVSDLQETETQTNYSPEFEDFYQKYQALAQFCSSSINIEANSDEAFTLIYNTASQCETAFHEYSQMSSKTEDTSTLADEIQEQQKKLNTISAHLSFETADEILTDVDKKVERISALEANMPDSILSSYGTCFVWQITQTINRATSLAKFSGIMPEEHIMSHIKKSIQTFNQGKYENLRAHQV